ncbi:MAG: hypothetical protein ACON4G_06860 [Candidatus Puniceispirillaceae bacterium]
MKELIRAYVTLFRQGFVAMLYFVALVFLMVSYELIKQGDYLIAALLGLGAPVIAISLHWLINKLLKRFDLKGGKKWEEMRSRNPFRY